MEARYMQSLRDALGDLTRPVSVARESVYEGEQAFQLQTQCIRSDGHPFYRLDIPGMDHDTLLYILTSLQMIPSIMSLSSGIRKRTKISKELDAIGVSWASSWISGHKDGTYTLSVRHIPWDLCRDMCKVLFSW